MRSPLIALAAVVLVLALLSCSPSGADEKKPPSEEASVWMQKKLEFSQKILAGLTEGDFEKIGKNAEAMNFLGFFEKYARAEMPEYKKQLTLFESANQELLRQAKAKNLEGVTLAYNQLTVSCVQCHKLIRAKGSP